MTAPTAPELRRLAELYSDQQSDETLGEELYLLLKVGIDYMETDGQGAFRYVLRMAADLMDERDRLAAMVPRWIPVNESLPEPGRYVLVLYEGDCGNVRWTRAEYSNGKSLHAAEEGMDDSVYDEEADEFFCPVGWYEFNAPEETQWRVDGDVTHWMYAPTPPPAPSTNEPAAKEGA